MALEPKSEMNRLLTPPDRIAQNVYRDAIRKIAQNSGRSSLDIDEACTRARTELGLLLHNDKFRDRYEELVDHSKKLLATGKSRVLDDPNQGGKSPEEYREFVALHHELEGYAATGTAEVKVSKDDIKTFMSVIEECKNTYKQRNYDPSTLISENLYRIAQMTLGNFEAYEATLHEKE